MDEERNENMRQMPDRREQLDLRRAFVRRNIAVPDTDAAWQQVKERTRMEVTDAENRRRASWRQLVLAIGAVAAGILGFVLLLRPSGQEATPRQVFTANRETQAITVTADGQPYAVSKPAISFFKTNASGTVHDMAVSTSRGKDCRLTLPDSSTVWLNAESKIEFPERFADNERRVKLSGEAYFEVKKDARRPFVVETNALQASVLGTSFNVRAYDEVKTEVVLVEGSVKVTGGGSSLLIRPGQQAVMQAGHPLQAADIDVYPLIQWKDGLFYYDNTPLKNIMQDMGRWYNINIVFENPHKMSVNLHFVAERASSLPDMIRCLNALEVAVFTVEGNAIVVR